MKRITRIIISFCLMLMLTEGVNGQVRFGVESNVGFGPYYKYDSSGYYEDKDRAAFLLVSCNIFYDAIFPRSWTPNWMALSMQFGAGFMSLCSNDSYIGTMYQHDFGNYYAYYHGKKYNKYISVGANIPIGFDVKFLMSDNLRFFINLGIINYLNITNGESVGRFDLKVDKLYVFGYGYGCGFEFGPLRIGYKLTSFPKFVFEGKLGNKNENMHTLNLGIMFNGNRFLKRNSHLKVY